MPDDLEAPSKSFPPSPQSGGRADLSRLTDQQLLERIDDAVHERTYRVSEPGRSVAGQLLLDLLAERSRRPAP